LQSTDGSTNLTRRVCAPFDAAYRYARQPKTGGQQRKAFSAPFAADLPPREDMQAMPSSSQASPSGRVEPRRGAALSEKPERALVWPSPAATASAPPAEREGGMRVAATALNCTTSGAGGWHAGAATGR